MHGSDNDHEDDHEEDNSFPAVSRAFSKCDPERFFDVLHVEEVAQAVAAAADGASLLGVGLPDAVVGRRRHRFRLLDFVLSRTFFDKEYSIRYADQVHAGRQREHPVKSATKRALLDQKRTERTVVLLSVQKVLSVQVVQQGGGQCN